jgi:very-short-patch-repair endonuclease
MAGAAHCQGMRLSNFDQWARQHHGLLTLLASGLSNDAWHRAVRSGSLIELHRHVARFPGTKPDQTQRIHAAVLAAGDGTMASHQSAAALWHLLEPDDGLVHIIITDRNRRPTLDGVMVHRPTDRQRLQPQRRHNIRCTDPLRTLCDLGAEQSALVSPAVGAALTARLVDIDALTSAAVAHSKRGRPGTAALRSAIDDWAIDHRPADSVLELVFAELVQRHHLPSVAFHERICGWEVDFRFVGTSLLVECDGWGTHGLDRDQFERDRKKDSDLSNAGWQVLRFTYRAVVNEAADTAQRIRRALTRWGHLDVPDAA